MKKLSTIHKIHLLLGVHIILWLNAANYSYIGSAIPTIVKLGLVGLWFGITLLGNKRFLPRYIVVGYWFAFFAFLCVIGKMAGTGDYFDQYGMNLVYWFIMLGVFVYYFYAGTKEELRFLLIVYVLDIVIVSINTYITLLAYPELARLLSTSAEHKEEILGTEIPKGVGGYGLCYVLVLLQPLLAYYLNKKKVNLLIKIVVHSFVMLLLFQAQITLAFVAYPILLIISYTYGKKENVKILLTKLVLLALIVVLVVSLPVILGSLIEVADYHLAVRLEELRSLLTTGEMKGDDMLSRLVLYQKSSDAFFASPVWGAFGGKVYGSHSTFLDILAAFGLFGLIGYCGMLRPAWMARTIVKADKGLKKTYWLIFGTTVVLSILNPIMGSDILLATTVIIPLSYKYLTMEQSTNNEIGSN